MQRYHLFVYGSLQNEELARKLLGRKIAPVGAVLEGFRKIQPTSYPYPVAIRNRRGRIEGKLIRDLSTADLACLDAYEEIPASPYERAAVTVKIGRRRVSAFAYVARRDYEII